MSIAEKLSREAWDSEGHYARPPDWYLQKRGGTRIASSNWDSDTHSWSPNETWQFPDGSVLYVEHQQCYATA